MATRGVRISGGAFAAVSIALGVLVASCSLINKPEDSLLGPGEQGCVKASDCTHLAGNPCGEPTCQNGMCVLVPTNEGGDCDDGMFCTDSDKCAAGACVGTPKTCMGSTPCHVGQCNEATQQCEDMAGNDGQACDDMNPCDDPGTCMAGTCQKGPDKCQKLANECASASCGPSGCVTSPINEGGACDLGNICATSTCKQGKCDGTPVPGIDGASCDDGKFCTVDEVCSKGKCLPPGLNRSICPPDEGCGTWTCDEVNKTCVLEAKNEGMSCSFGTCESAQTCKSGVCTGPSSAQVYFFDDFRDNSKGWTMPPPATGNGINDWTIGSAVQSRGGQLLDGASMQKWAPDPGEDHTPSTFDNGVAGVNLGQPDVGPQPTGSGNADRNLHDFYYLVSPPIDTAIAPGQVQLSFYRWLDSDYPPFMVDTIDIWNGGAWVSLFQNQTNTLINDNHWTFEVFDITAYKSSGMQIRFGYSVTGAGVYAVGSWNIDDLLIADTTCP